VLFNGFQWNITCDGVMKIPMADQKNFASENDDSLMLTLINCWNKFSHWEDLPYSERDLAVAGKEFKLDELDLIIGGKRVFCWTKLWLCKIFKGSLV